MPTPLGMTSPRVGGVLLRAKMPRKCPVGTSITSPVRIRVICPGGTVTSCAAARSNPAASSVPYAGRATVGFSRRILSRMGAAYLLSLFLFTAAARAQDLTAPLGIDPEVHAGKLPNGLTFLIRRNA